MATQIHEDCEAICALAQSGIPFGSYLASKLQKKFYLVSHKDDFVDWQGKRLPCLPERPALKRVVLVDSIIKTGSTAGKVCKLLRSWRAEPLQLITAVDFSIPQWRSNREFDIPLTSVCKVTGRDNRVATLLGLREEKVAVRLAQPDFWARANDLPVEVPEFLGQVSQARFAANILDEGLERALWDFLAESTGCGIYSLFLNPRMLANCFEKLLQKASLRFDALVACSLHAFPFAAWFLQILHGKGIGVPLYYLSHTARHLRNPPDAGCLSHRKVLLLDSSIRTGGHAGYAYNMCKMYESEPNALVCLLDYDNAESRHRLLDLSQKQLHVLSLARVTKAPSWLR